MIEQSPLAQYREANRKTLDELGTALGVDKSTMLRWERGRVPAERVLDVERLTGISRDVLRPDLAKIFAGAA